MEREINDDYFFPMKLGWKNKYNNCEGINMANIKNSKSTIQPIIK